MVAAFGPMSQGRCDTRVVLEHKVPPDDPSPDRPAAAFPGFAARRRADGPGSIDADAGAAPIEDTGRGQPRRLHERPSRHQRHRRSTASYHPAGLLPSGRSTLFIADRRGLPRTSGTGREAAGPWRGYAAPPDVVTQKPRCLRRIRWRYLQFGIATSPPINARSSGTIELRERGIPFVREARLPVHYRDRLLPLFYTVDFICYDEILVELKALRAIGPVEEAQLINYLRVARRSRGLVLNFGATSLQHRRLVLNLTNEPADHCREGMTSGAGREAAGSWEKRPM